MITCLIAYLPILPLHLNMCLFAHVNVSLLCISSECSREFLENVDFPGTDITSVYSPDVEHCQLLCTQHPSCLFFTFVRADWTVDNRYG